MAKEEGTPVNSVRVAMQAMLIALGVVLGPFYFPVLDSKAFPFQHTINVIAAVLIGLVDAAIIATIIGIIRNALGLGTIFAFPGGIPGGIIVGFFFWAFRKMGRRNYAEFSAFTEPIGTVLIGGTVSVLIIAPAIGREMLLLVTWAGWLISSGIGCALGFIIVKALKTQGITRETLFRKPAGKQKAP